MVDDVEEAPVPAGICNAFVHIPDGFLVCCGVQERCQINQRWASWFRLASQLHTQPYFKKIFVS
jgi:hypothetical protein